MEKELQEIANRLDDIGLRQRKPDSEIPGTTEKIAMELTELNKTMYRIMELIEGILSIQNER